MLWGILPGRQTGRCQAMMTNKKHRRLMLALIYEYEKQLCLRDRMDIQSMQTSF